MTSSVGYHMWLQLNFKQTNRDWQFTINLTCFDIVSWRLISTSVFCLFENSYGIVPGSLWTPFPLSALSILIGLQYQVWKCCFIEFVLIETQPESLCIWSQAFGWDHGSGLLRALGSILVFMMYWFRRIAGSANHPHGHGRSIYGPWKKPLKYSG